MLRTRRSAARWLLPAWLVGFVIFAAAPPRAAAADTLGVGQRIVTVAEATVRAQAAPTAQIRARYPIGRLGTIIGGPVPSGGAVFWQVDFDGLVKQGIVDGWVRARELGLPSFPPPDAQGGWPSLVPRDREPTAAQKAELLARGGVDWDKLKLARDYSASFGTANTSVLVIRNGYVVGDWGSQAPYTVASVSKGLAGLTVMKLLDLAEAGQLPVPFGLDTPAHQLLPAEWAASDPGKHLITIRHFMTHTSGLQPHDTPGAPDYYNLIMSLPVVHPPRRVWSYTSAGIDLMSIAMQRATGILLGDAFNQHIAAPIGAGNFRWNNTAGFTRASGTAQTTPRDLARVGYLMLHRGRWDHGAGQRVVVSDQRIRDLQFACRCASLDYGGTGWSYGPRVAGMTWWNNSTGELLGERVPGDAVLTAGLRETLLVVVRSRNLVVVRFGLTPRSLDEFRRVFMGYVMASLKAPKSL